MGKIDKRISTKIKRILNMGVLIEPDMNMNYLINEDEAIETVEKILRSVNKGTYIKPAISGKIEPLFIERTSPIDENVREIVKYRLQKQQKTIIGQKTKMNLNKRIFNQKENHKI